MTVKQYSDIQRCLGKLEGIGAGLPDDTAAFFFDTMEVLEAIIEELAPEEEKPDGA